MVGQARSARWLAVVVVCTAILGTDALPLNEQLEGVSLAGRRLLQDPQREKRKIEREVTSDDQGVLEQHAEQIAERSRAEDDKALYVAAQAQIDKAATSVSAQQHQQVKAQLRGAAREAHQAAENARTETAIERLEASAGIKQQSKGKKRGQLGASGAPESLEQLHIKAAKAEEQSARAEAEAEAAQREKMEAEQRVEAAASRHTEAEEDVVNAQRAHKEALEQKSEADKKKRGADAAAHLKRLQAAAAAKAVEEQAMQEAEHQQLVDKSNRADALAQRKLRNQARLEASETLQKADLKAQKLQLAAQAEAVARESGMRLKQARREASATLMAAKKQAAAELDAVKARVQQKSEMAIRAEAARQKLVEQVGATERMVEDQEAEKQFHQAQEADVAAKQSKGTEEEAKLTDPPPEVSIARLETKLDGLEQQKNKPTPHLISTQQIATQEETASTATSAGLSDQAPVTADSLEEHALKRLHVGLENSVHDASKRSKQELAAEAEAKSAQIHLDKLEANDVNNIVASNEPTK